MAMTNSTIDRIQMDHVALASTHAWDQVIRYNYHFGGRWLGGPVIDDETAFYFCQVEFEGGTKLELLEPLDVAGSDFLRRFLHRNGPGPHHFTFKVADFDASVEAVIAAGYDVIGIDRSDPEWSEGFLHPKQSHGIVIQLAHHAASGEGWTVDSELPPAMRPEQPRLVAVDHLVADLDAAVDLFTGPLGMTCESRSSNGDGENAVLTSGPWRLRLIKPERTDWAHWLGSRSGRLLQLQIALDEPGTIPGAVPLGESTYVVPPEANLGTRLLLKPRGDCEAP